MNKYFFQILKQQAGIACLLFILLSNNNKLFSQSPYNLVSNYSFEDSALCPYTTGAAPPKPWYRTSSTPYAIYCNTCSSSLLSSVPYNIWGYTSYQYPYDGNAYIGGDLLNHPNLNGNGRTYAEVKLNESLQSGQCYYVEFYTSLVNTSQYACNNVSISLSKNQLWQSGNPVGVIPFNAQIYNYGNPVITDTMNWVKVCAVYTAQGGEQFLTVGNFKNDSQTNYILVDSIVNIGNPKASYYFDAIQVIPLSQEPAYANAFAGDDITITAGDSVFVGSLINGVSNIAWFNSTGQKIDSIRPGFWVHPQQSTYYVVEQTVCSNYSNDTIFITVQPLPLKFTSYEVSLRGTKQSVENIWQTANEINVSHFYVQRSTNGRDYKIIGQVKSQNKTLNTYSFVDEEPQEGTNYYRIIAVDIDGKTSYSEVRTINFKPETLIGFSVYPNPSTGSFKLKLPNAKPNEIVNCTVTITDIYGKQVLQQRMVQVETQLNIGGAKGTYFITMFNSANGKQTVSKIVLQ